MEIEIILLEPQTSGNVGAIARAMKNFGFSKLVLVSPQCDHLDNDGIARSMRGRDVLESAQVVSEVPKYDYLIATTAKLGGDYNIKRSPLTPEELGEKLNEISNSKIGILFGREDKGLTNEEIRACDFIVSIPATKEYPVMNLSHSVTVILYELFKKLSVERNGDNIEPVGEKEKQILLEIIDNALEKMDFQTEEKRETQKFLWQRIVGKSMLTNREAQAVMGLFKKIKFL